MRLLIVATIAFLAGILAWQEPAAAAKELRLTIHLPKENSHEYDNLLVFKELVEKGTKGELQISIHPGGTLFEAEQVPQAVGSGAIEMGATLLEHYDDEVPAVDIFINPFMFFSPEMLAAGLAPGSPVRAPLDRAILGVTGGRVLWWMPAGAAVMLSKTAPIKTPADIKGKTVHVPGKVMARFAALCGGTPIEDKLKDEREVYKSGRAQVGFSDISDVEANKLWEVMDTLTITRHEVEVFLVTINERVWQSLTESQRKVMQGAALEAERKLAAEIDEIERKDFAHAEAMGMKVVELTRAETEQWKACAIPIIGEYIGKSGVLGNEVVAGYRQVLVDLSKPPSERGAKK